jgi:hypothetical protein
MIQPLRLFCGALIGLLRSSARREAEILVLRHQINVLRRKSPNRPALSNVDRLLFVLLSRLVPDSGSAGHSDPLAPRRFPSRLAMESGGRPRTPDEIRQLIRNMSISNPLWGAPRIHGELLKLGIDVGQTTGR